MLLIKGIDNNLIDINKAIKNIYDRFDIISKTEPHFNVNIE